MARPPSRRLGLASLTWAAAMAMVCGAARADAGQPSPTANQRCGVTAAEGGSKDAPPPGMVWIPGGRFAMGSNSAYPEEAPVHPVSVHGFWMSRCDVTNRQFGEFIAATGYRTAAEKDGAGSVVFIQPRDGSAGAWRFVAGANWRQPEGPGSNLQGREEHPVVHITYEDASAYAAWKGEQLPTEAQWEYAARGGMQGKTYVWGNELAPKGKVMANTWQGDFPFQNTAGDGYSGTSPVASFPANSFGLFDMAGNVWQWTRTWFTPHHSAAPQDDPAGPTPAESLDPRQPGVQVRVIKGGSHLCAPTYCRRYRPSARQAQDPGLGTSHLGFRTVLNPIMPAQAAVNRRPG